MPKEEDLYEPIKKTLQEKFSVIGECHLEVTASKIGEEIKQLLDDQAVFILENEKKKPDLMGYVSTVCQSASENKRLIVVEVKSDALRLNNIYQVKLYAEMFPAHYAFLISPRGFNEVHRRFLKVRRSLLSFAAGYRNITVMRLLDDASLELDNELNITDPFAF